MDMAFSGLMTAAVAMVQRGVPFDAVCWSLQEHAFAACVEVAERARPMLENTSSSSVAVLQQRLRDMCDIMASEREEAVMHHSNVLHRQRHDDRHGWLELQSGRTTPYHASAVDPGLRTDATPIAW